MKLLFPQATISFNKIFSEMIEKSIAKSFLDKALNSYDLENINELVIILLKNELIENFFNNYLENNNEEWRRNAHALKGIAFNLGAYDFAELAKKGQEECDCSKEEKKLLLDQLKKTHDDVVVYLKNEMS